jgi:uncharacterized membrane protein
LTRQSWGAGLAKILDILVWGWFGLILIYLGWGRPQIANLSGLDFPDLGLAATLVIRMGLTRYLSWESAAWHHYWTRLVSCLMTRPGLTLGIISFLYFWAFFGVAALQHWAFQSSVDLGNFCQALWSTLQGEIMYSSVRGFNMLGDHLVAILFLIVPLYAVFPSPYTVLFIQTLALAAGGAAVYLLAKDETGRLDAALGLGLVYLCHRTVFNMSLMDFHPIALATPLWLWALALRRKGPLVAGILAVLALSCSEESWIFLVGFGLYTLLGRRKAWQGLAFTALGMAGFLVITGLVIPSINPGGSYHIHQTHFPLLGPDLTSAFATLVNKPLLLINHIMTAPKMWYVFALLASVLFLPLAAPWSLVLFAPIVAGNLLSDHAYMWSLDRHYTACVIPGLFWGAAMGWRNLLKKTWVQKIPATAVLGVAALTALISLDQSPLGSMRRLLQQDPSDAYAIVQALPEGAPVAAQPIFLPHLARNMNMSRFPWIPKDIPYITICTEKDPWPYSKQELLVLVGRLKSQGYRVKVQKGSCLLLYKPPGPGSPSP